MTDETMNPKTDKREAILQAALKVIAENGLQNAPMSLISKRSKASPGIIYHYFESKDELVQTIYDRIYGNSLRAFQAADNPREPLAKRFQTLWLSVYDYCFNHPLEIAFLDQYENSPMTQQAKNPFNLDTRSLDGLLASLREQNRIEQLSPEEKTLVGLMADLRAQNLIRDLPPAVIGEFAVGVARRLARQAATGQLSLDEYKLNEVALACWNAVAC